ncbi:hypothetical protein MMC06_003908 [Schaereria dolodes]|nr:hypothetical protein [Schaereria dolodes]
MLRLPPTQIALGVRDLDWHADRHRNRQAQRASDGAHRLRQTQLKANAGTREKYVASVPFRFPHTPSGQPIGRRNLEDSLISDEPVPRGSRPFWDRILADAGSIRRAAADSTQDKTQEHAERSSRHDSSEKSAQSRVSEYEDRGAVLGNMSNEDGTEYIEEETYLSAYHNEIESPLRSRASVYSPESPDKGHDAQALDSRLVPTDQARKITSRHRHPFFTFRRKQPPAKTDEDGPQSQYQHSSHMDLDGSADLFLEPIQINDVSPNADIELGISDYFDVRQSKRVISSSMEIDTNVDVIDYLLKYSSPFSEPSNRSSPPLPIIPRSVEAIRLRSGGLPRSPLYMSQGVASSSPEKIPSIHVDYDTAGASQGSDLLSLSPRRRKRYKLRSISYSFAESEVPESTMSLNDKAHSHASAANPSQRSRFGSPASSPNIPDKVIDPVESQTPAFNISTNTQHSQSLSTPSPVRSVSPHNSPLLPLPPPFSTTPRLVSFGLALPSSSPTNQFIGSLHQHPYQHLTNNSIEAFTASPPIKQDIFNSPITNSSRTTSPFHLPSYHLRGSPIPTTSPHVRTLPHPRAYVPSPSPPPPMTPHRSMRVYNDSLPASSQPQTPVGLARHGVLGVQYSAAFTAPVGGLRRGRRRDGRVWGMDMGQENIGVEVEAERILTGVEGRRGNGDGLEVTPPRGVGRLGV